MIVHRIIRAILLVGFVGNFTSVSCMTEDVKKGTKKTVLTSEADVQFYLDLDKALDTKDSKVVTQAFEHAGETGADIKLVMSSVDDEHNNFMHRAIKKSCGLDILKLLQKQGVELCGIEHANPTLRTACLQWQHPEQEAIIKWLIEQDSYVPGAEFVRIGAVDLLTSQAPISILPKFAVEMLGAVSKIAHRSYDLQRVMSITKWFMKKKVS